MPNNVLILQFDTSWVGEDGLLCTFLGNFRFWVLVLIFDFFRVSEVSFSIPLVIPQIGKKHWFWPDFRANYSPLYEVFFDDLGTDWLLFFQENTKKLKFGIFETLRGHIFNHIGGAQRRFLMYFPYYLLIRKYAWKTVQNWFFSKFSKTSEKVAFSRKNLGEYPGNQSRCRYDRRKKSQIDKQNFFWFRKSRARL